MNYYPHHIGDFRSGTVNMSRQSRWIYRDMMDVYYDTEKALPLDIDVLCDMLGVEADEERKIVERLLRFKFVETGEGYTHVRCDEEIAIYHKKAVTARTNGKGGGRPRKAAASEEKPTGFLSGSDQDAIGNQSETGSKANQEPRTKNQDKETPPNPRKRGNGFDASKIELPDWLDRDDWETWVKDRRDRKRPITEAGARQQLTQLETLKAQGHRPEAVIANSIAGGYQGLFPPRAPPGDRTTYGGQTTAQRRSAWNEELNRELAETLRPREIDMGVIDATH